MTKKNKKGQHIVFKGESWVVSKYLGQISPKKIAGQEKSEASLKRYGRVLKQVKKVFRYSKTGKFVSISPGFISSKGARGEKVSNRTAVSSSNPKSGTRIGGPKRK